MFYLVHVGLQFLELDFHGLIGQACLVATLLQRACAAAQAGTHAAGAGCGRAGGWVDDLGGGTVVPCQGAGKAQHRRVGGAGRPLQGGARGVDVGPKAVGTVGRRQGGAGWGLDAVDLQVVLHLADGCLWSTRCRSSLAVAARTYRQCACLGFVVAPFPFGDFKLAENVLEKVVASRGSGGLRASLLSGRRGWMIGADHQGRPVDVGVACNADITTDAYRMV